MNTELKGYYNEKGFIKIDNDVFTNAPESKIDEIKVFLKLFVSNLEQHKKQINTIDVYTFNLSVNKRLCLAIKDNKINLYCVDKVKNIVTQTINEKELYRLMRIENNIIFALDRGFCIDNVNMKSDYLMANLLLNSNSQKVLGYTVEADVEFDR